MAVALSVLPEVAEALANNRSVVALESTLIAHGLPWPTNLETAREAEEAIRQEGVIPATIAVLDGTLRIGLAAAELERLSTDKSVFKASRRDLAAVIAKGQTAATTVAATMFLAHRAGIRLFATGGIGGVHREPSSFDISADLFELARTQVCVVCAGAKSILDIPATLEVLETHGVPVVGYGANEFPGFYLRSSGVKIETRVDSPEEAARLLEIHWDLNGAGVVLAQSPPANMTMDENEFNAALSLAERDAHSRRICGKALTPFLLQRLVEITRGKTLVVNRALVVGNARLAARVAKAML
jgi:pseudouridylate synthase